MGLPKIIINFIQKAASLFKRSEKGIVCLVLDDATGTAELYIYELLGQIKETDWTAENYKIIRDTLSSGASKVMVVRVGAEKTFVDVKATIDSAKFNWIAYTNAAAQQIVVDYIKDRNKVSKGRKIKAIVYKAVKPDNEHIVNFINEKVKRITDEEEIAGNAYLGRLAGVLAALPFTRSSTYFELTDLEYVAEPEDVEKAIDEGNFVIINDYGEPKIGRGVNSLQTIADNKTEDWKSIVIIEAMDLMLEDIYTSFKEDYVGKYKNRYENQCVFLSAVNRYFEAIAKEQVLDSEYDNHAEIDIEAQRGAWLDIGKTEAANWGEQTVKKNTFKKSMFLQGQVKILDAMEDLVFNIGIM